MVFVNMEIPEEMVSFVVQSSKEEQLKRNAMMLYPYVHDGIISHGKVAEILGIFKERALESFDYVMDCREVPDFVEVTGRMGGNVITYRVYDDGSICER